MLPMAPRLEGGGEAAATTETGRGLEDPAADPEASEDGEAFDSDPLDRQIGSVVRDALTGRFADPAGTAAEA